MDGLLFIIKEINGILWGSLLLFLLCGTGVFFTIKLRFIQVREFIPGLRDMFGGFNFFGKKAGADGMSSFQAVATSIAAQVGTGNLAGAATALYLGGPGAIFWMWVSAFFGMATIYAEATLAQRYKQRVDGEVVGGPAYYMKDGIKNKKIGKIMAILFSFFTIINMGFAGAMVQANSISEAFLTAFKVPTLVSGITIGVLAVAIFMGGVKSIASVTEKLVPVMAGFYIIGALFVVGVHANKIPYIFSSIVKGAFAPTAIWGGVLGMSIKEAIRYGVARGLFSNEAGMGSTPHAHAVARVKHPGEQGVLAMICVFIDTFIILTLTAFVIIGTGSLENNPQGFSGIRLTQESFALGLGSVSHAFIAICLVFFAFSTIVGWYYFGESNIKYVFGKYGVLPYQIGVFGAIVLGANQKLDFVWEISDLFNGLMVLPNLVALLMLSPMVSKIANDYDIYKKTGSSADPEVLSTVTIRDEA